MANILRRFRQTMLKENRFSRYLLYAIGEIILVVIGILIALQINTYNKELHNRKLEQTSLESLKADLMIQKDIIHEQIANEVSMLNKVDSVFLYSGVRIVPDSLYRLLVELASRHTFVSNKATFLNMGATGDVVLLHDHILQEAVVRYYQELDYTTAVINNNNLFLIDNHFGTYVFDNGPSFQLNKQGSINTDFVMSPAQLFTLRSQLDGRRKASESINRLCKELLESTDKLIGLIDAALK